MTNLIPAAMMATFLFGATCPFGATPLRAQAPPTFRTAGLDLQLELDYTRQWLKGRAAMVAQNYGERGNTELALQVGRLMKVVSVTTGDGRALTYQQSIVSYPDWTLRQVNAVRVQLSAAVAAQDSTTVVVAYEGHLVGASETGMLYVRERLDPAFTVLREESFAFPVIGAASRAAMRGIPRRDFVFTARITVPDTLVVANGGELVERRVHDARATYTWRSRYPVPFLNIAIAPYRVFERGSVRAYVLPADTVHGRELLGAIDRSLAWLQTRYGELARPAAFSVMEIPDGYGSQADLNAGIMIDASALRRIENRRYLYHEISHLWNARDREVPSARWNEGLASYLETRVAAELDGVAAAPSVAWTIKSVCQRVASDAQLRTVPMERYGVADFTGWSYSVGALLFGVLDGVLGREKFDRAYRTAFQKAKADTISLDALEQAFAATDPRARAIFKDWVRTAEWQDRLCPTGDLAAVIGHYAGTARSASK